MKNKFKLGAIFLGGALLLVFLLTRGELFKNNVPSGTEAQKDSASVEREAMEEVEREYGMRTDSFRVVKGTVRPNQFLAEILRDYGVPYSTIDRLVEKADTVFDVSELRAGRDYTVFCNKDSSGKAQCFVYQADPANYVFFDLRDSLQVKRGKKEVKTRRKTASGKIQHSLFMAMDKKAISPLVALELSEIYAWSIDFYRIKKGDRFRLIYEEHFVDGESIGIGDVLAAEFVHRDSSYYAFRFERDSASDYFDEKGKSMKKALLKAPLRFSRISSGFSHSRFHPVLKVRRPHHGVDYAAPTGTPVRSVGSGRVIASSYASGNGNYIKVRHNSVYTTMYLHLSSRAVRRGERVEQGELIGRVGSTGLSTGPHLDYRVVKNGTAVNPLTLDLPPGDPVEKEHREAFKERKAELMKELQEIPYEGGSSREPV